MDNPTDGGPAFPAERKIERHLGKRHSTNGLADVTEVSIEKLSGMSLRDYFASEASRGAADVLCDMLQPDDPMTAFDPVSKLADVQRHAEQHARCAYLYADAMLAARAAKSPRERQDEHIKSWREGR